MFQNGHWRVAQQQARIAAATRLGGGARLEAAPFFWTYHYGQNFDYLGHADVWNEEVIVGEVEGRNFVALLLQSERVAAVVACLRQRPTAALALRMSAPLTHGEALRLVEEMS